MQPSPAGPIQSRLDSLKRSQHWEKNFPPLDSRLKREQQDSSRLLLLASGKHAGNVPAPSIFDWLVDNKHEKTQSFCRLEEPLQLKLKIPGGLDAIRGDVAGASICTGSLLGGGAF